jgi:putative toxin-antitoxin system antitoxin component (TIGR02293 family)
MSTALTKQPAKKSSAAVGAPRKSGAAAIKKIPAGIVQFYLHQNPGGKVVGPKISEKLAPSNLVQLIEAGLPMKELEDLQASLGVPMETLFPLLGISKATLHRRKASGKLGPVESDRVVRFANLLGKAAKVFGNIEDARQWLNSPQFGLGGAMPLDYAKTEIGAREVENLLGRIEYGVYS